MCNILEYLRKGLFPPFLISCAASADHEEVNPCDEDQTEDLSRIREETMMIKSFNKTYNVKVSKKEKGSNHEEVNPCDEDQTEDLSRIRKVSRF